MSLVAMATQRWLAAGFLIGLLLCGCGGERVKLVPVEGVVKINGQPAANIAIQFLPDVLKGNKGPTSFASTDEQGKFRLKTYDGRDGAVVGPHRAVLSDLAEERPPQGQPARQGPRLDAAFTDPTRGIVVEVREGGAPLELLANGPPR